MYPNLVSPKKASPTFNPSPELSPSEVLRVLQRTRKNAYHAKKLFLANDLNSAEGLLIASFEALLRKIESGTIVKFSDLLRLAKYFNRDNLEIVGE